MTFLPVTCNGARMIEREKKREINAYTIGMLDKEVHRAVDLALDAGVNTCE